MSNVIERVYRLVALAGSSNENEASAAAVKACRLIRQHDLRITGSDAASEAPESAPPSPTWDTIMRAVGVGMEQAPGVLKKAAEIAEGVHRVRDAIRGKR